MNNKSGELPNAGSAQEPVYHNWEAGRDGDGSDNQTWEKHLQDVARLKRTLKIAKAFVAVSAVVTLACSAAALSIVLHLQGEMKENMKTWRNEIQGYKHDVEDKVKAFEATMVAPESCATSLENGYQLLRNGRKEFCDNGWTVFQRRFDGSVDFRRTWQEYKMGFGNQTGEFWLGLEKIHRLTRGQKCRLRVELQGFGGGSAYAEYSSFSIEDELEKYRLHVAGYNGTAGDGFMSQYANLVHNEMAFSTKDRDNDRSTRHCASNGIDKAGGWWFNDCFQSSLNAPWGRTSGRATKMIWSTWKGRNASVKGSLMKLRCD